MITVIRCESSCDNVMAAWHDAEDAHEIAAYETGHYDSDAGYECNACYDARFAEGMAMARAYDAEMRIAQMRKDHEEWQDSIFANADLAYDAMRDCAS